MTGNGSFKVLLIAPGQLGALGLGEEELLNIFLGQGFRRVNLSELLHELRSVKPATGSRLFICTATAEESLSVLHRMGGEAASLQPIMAPLTPLDFNSRRFWQLLAELQAASATQTAVHGSTAESRALTTDLRLREPS